MRHLPFLASFAFAAATLGQSPAAPTPKPDPDEVRTANGTLVARLVREPHDPNAHLATSKVYHHVYAPDGRLLTKGLGGTFPHHRGLFVGWNKTTFGGTQHDFWHCGHGETQQFRGFASDEQKPGPRWQVAEIDWCTKAGEVALHESRAVRARTIADDVTALDVLMFLRAEHGAVKLDGDPQHAGHQFRALQQFAEEGDDAPKVHYVRPPDAVAHDNDVWTDCAWIAAVLPLPEGSVTVLRIEDPRNGAPGPWQPTWSTRAYGRFGAMFEREIPDGGHLGVGWTYVVALGERDAEWCAKTASSQSLAAVEPSPSTRR